MIQRHPKIPFSLNFRTASGRLLASAAHPLHIVSSRALETKRTETLTALDGFLTGLWDLR